MPIRPGVIVNVQLISAAYKYHPPYLSKLATHASRFGIVLSSSSSEEAMIVAPIQSRKVMMQKQFEINKNLPTDRKSLKGISISNTFLVSSTLVWIFQIYSSSLWILAEYQDSSILQRYFCVTKRNVTLSKLETRDFSWRESVHKFGLLKTK